MARDYAAAIEALNTLQTNASILEAIRKSGRAMNECAIPEMIGWCQCLGYEPEDFNKLNVIHIAGTKGKGSTSAFISSILQRYIPHSQTASATESSITSAKSTPQQPYPVMVGLYTSPHLRSVRERIRINSKPLSEATFARFFFETWDRLEASFASDQTQPDSSRHEADPATADPVASARNPSPKPVYFRYLTLMALHTYLTLATTTFSQSPSSAHLSQLNTTNFALVLETGVGGTYDSTNIIPSPLITAITSLALDHTAILGNTLSSIADHKSGIFKSGSPHPFVYTSPQSRESMAVLEQRAKDAGKKLCVVDVHPDIASKRVNLGLDGEFQKVNASLAVSVAAAWLRERGYGKDGEKTNIPRPGTDDELPEEFQQGLKMTKWGGRCEIRPDPVLGNEQLKWYLDGGHTVESVRLAGEWFARRKGTAKGRRILLFNQQTRDAPALARSLHAVLSSTLRSLDTSTTSTSGHNSQDRPPAETQTSQPFFTHAIFSTNITYSAPPNSTSNFAPGNSNYYKPDLSINTPTSTMSSLHVQHFLAGVWTELERNAGRNEVDVRVLDSIGDAVDVVRSLAQKGVNGGRVVGPVGRDVEGLNHEEETAVFVTGSLHLVGGVLEVLGAGDSESEGE